MTFFPKVFSRVRWTGGSGWVSRAGQEGQSAWRRRST